MKPNESDVIDHKSSFWNPSKIAAIGVFLLAIATGVGYFTHDSVNSSATLLTKAQEPATYIKAHDDYLEVEPLAASTAPADRSLELWAISPDGTPVSLGLLPEDGKGIIGLNPRQQESIKKPVELLVSSETKGGSLNNRPSGPAVYQGSLAIL